MIPPVDLSSVTCLGCSCTCDDIEVVIHRGAIVETRNACAIGRQWFGDGKVPAAVRVDGVDATLEHALQRAAAVMAAAARPRVVLGGNVACETHREAVACADLLKARLDILSSPAATTFSLAIQEHGIATSTLGEARNRADVVVFWGVDPDSRFPRFRSRYLPEPTSGTLRPTHTVAVDIADATGPSDASARVRIDKTREAETLTALGALLGSRVNDDHPQAVPAAGDVWRVAAELASHLQSGSYIVVVADASGEHHDSGRAHRLLGLARALNASGRGTLILLHDGTNLVGASSVLTRHTGYPGSVDFASGVPRYEPHARVSRDTHDALLFVGVPGRQQGDLDLFNRSKVVVIGPGASESLLADAVVVIDSATAGIHAGGTAARMDEVLLPLKAVLAGPSDATVVCNALLRRLQRTSS